jgi:hypothetical protein
MRTLKYLLPLLIAPFCFAQGNPNCTLNFTLNAAGSSSNFANSTPACDKWTLTVYNIGFSGFSLTLQSAAAATTSTPSTFGTYGGTTATGSNPLTASGIATFTNGTVATPWMRVTLSGLTGTGVVYGVLQGSQTVISKGGGGGGGGGPTIAGTANQITATGAGCTTPSTATCTIAIATNPVLPGNPSTPGTFTSGVGSGATGALDLVGKTSGATSTVTVDDSNTATILKLPNDATSGLYAATSPTATPAAGCAQYNGTGTQAASTGTPCGGGTPGSTLFSSTSSATATATSPTSLIGTVTGSTTIPINTFAAGQYFQVIAQGYYSTPATPASLTINLNIGGTTRITTGAVVQIASVTNGTWRLSCGFTTRTAGASGTQIANCIFEGTGATLTPGEAPMQTSSTWTIDTTATQVIDVTATWSTTTGAPTIVSTNVVGFIPGAATGGGSTVTAAPPYIEIGSTFYTIWDMSPATKPTTPTYLNGVTCSSAPATTNGDLLLINTASVNCWAGYSATTSVEGVFTMADTGSAFFSTSVWLWDSTNNFIYVFAVESTGSGNTVSAIVFQKWAYNGTGNPSFSATIGSITNVPVGPIHFKWSVSGGTITAAGSLNGGSNFSTYYTQTGIGTISGGGVALIGNGTMDVASLVLN